MKTTLLTALLSAIAGIQMHAANEAATASNQFAFDCLAVLEKGKGNIAFSPYSAWTALTMTSAGAAGSTLEEMGGTLHIDRPLDNAIHHAAGEWISELNASKEITLATANRLWADHSFTPAKTFGDLVSKDYGAGFERLDFKKDPAAARTTINDWIAKQTANRIRDLLPPNAIKPDTRLILTNAIYFKAGWQMEFSPNKTNSAPFNLPGGKTAECKMMRLTGTFPYAEAAGYQAIRLPYKGKTISMILVLPAKGSSPELNATVFAKICQGLKDDRVHLGLPRFELDQKMSMVDLLGSLGMKKPFEPSADFSRLSPDVRLKIGEVIHQAFVKVGEKGTEAAAATAVAMELAMAAPSREEFKTFVADRTFYFFIVHNPSDGILFAGRVENPGSPKED